MESENDDEKQLIQSQREIQAEIRKLKEKEQEIQNKLDDYFLGFRKMVNIEKKTIVIYQDMFSIDLVGFFFKSNNSKN